ncbi:DUF3077 domain-containing protein [Pseudomonas gingeri]|uniref:DUF3077 domain-containing protein n=1 Tax=Pseudomonas gingeri TaxID=117681 RepID=A0A7Y7XG88_9PSED|nr:DUF3077 domain-containing protein [Pseudomonas gingeri]NWB99277.1 DUF3077 domain-containing protein [Pseudomonas gingeri]
MKKLVPDPPINYTRHRITAILKETNEALLQVMRDSKRPMLEDLPSTGLNTFGCLDGKNHPLFAVRPGINAEEALRHVSLLLMGAEEISDEITEASGIERGLIGSMVRSVEMARAVVDALLEGATARPA